MRATLDDSTYTVTVNGVGGDGTVGLDFDGATDIEDTAEQCLEYDTPPRTRSTRSSNSGAHRGHHPG